MTDKADELPVLPKEITDAIQGYAREQFQAGIVVAQTAYLKSAEDATEYVLAQINQQLKAELAAAKEQIAAYREELEDVRDDLDDNPDAYALIGIRARIGVTLGDFES